MRAEAKAFPQLEAILYFNDKEPSFWPEGYGSPDWSVDRETWERNVPATVDAFTGSIKGSGPEGTPAPRPVR
jgi:hypothetical protein